MQTDTILAARGLVKRYGRVTALDRADFELRRGEILAVIGDNGAGKSTLIKAISGAVRPDEGEIRLEGRPVHFHSPIEARKALPGLMNDLFGLAGADEEVTDKMEALMADARFVVRTECRYEIDIPTGLAERVECDAVQDISVAGESRRKETRLVATQRLVD